jgi:hypothetical protein
MKSALLITLSIALLIACNHNLEVNDVDLVVIDKTTKPKLKANETYEWGLKEARKDFGNDSLMLIRYGLEVESANPYWEILEKYQIYVKSQEGCVITPAMKAYNVFMEARIAERYGEDFFNKVDKKYQLMLKK